MRKGKLAQGFFHADTFIDAYVSDYDASQYHMECSGGCMVKNVLFLFFDMCFLAPGRLGRVAQVLRPVWLFLFKTGLSSSASAGRG